MGNKNIKKLKEDYYISVIKGLMDTNNGYITSKQVTELGIHRMYLSIMIKKKMIERVNKGVYLDISSLDDIYYSFQLRYPKTIFSGFTALYFHNLTEKYPSELEVTVNNNYHSTIINEKYQVNRSKDDIYNLGITEAITPYGNKVRVYDMEKCICDLIKNKDKYDYEQLKKSIRKYVKEKDINNINLSIYSKKMNIYKDVMSFVGMYYE